VSEEPVFRIPPEAREGLMRAWLAVLRKRHPDVLWIPVREEFRHLDPRGLPSKEAPAEGTSSLPSSQ
jgi:hypothetical protein